MDPQRVTRIKDVDGVDHDYSLTLFPFDIGFDLALEVGGLLGLPLGELITGADITGAGAGKLLDRDLSGFDWTTVLGALTRALSGVRAGGGHKLIQRLLVRCKRATQNERGEYLWADLSDPQAVNIAYSGNYLEALKAAAWVIRENWIPLSLGQGGIEGLLTWLSSQGATMIDPLATNPERAGE